MKFNPNKEFIKMLELMDKSPKINRFLWALLFSVFTIVLIYLLLNGLPPLINAIAQWQQISGK